MADAEAVAGRAPRRGHHDARRGSAGSIAASPRRSCARAGAAWIFLLVVGIATIGACTLFYSEDVTVKLLPFDNKSELQVVLNLPEGSSLEDTERTLFDAAALARALPEVRSVQAYAGTAAPFNFNGLVRHYYMRQSPELGDVAGQPRGEGGPHAQQPRDRARPARSGCRRWSFRQAARCRWWRCRPGRLCWPRCWQRSTGPMQRRDAPWPRR